VVPKAQENLDLREVESFVEKPDRERARALIAQGAMWNSMIFAAHGAGLVELFTRHFPCTVTRMKVLAARNSEPESPTLQLIDLYERLPSIDFSRDVLQEATERLRVSRAQPCGWNDLGTPRRVEEVVRGMARKPGAARVPERYSGAPPELAEVVRRRMRQKSAKAVVSQGELEAAV
jgi:mannose-1-phosphate guanylyltransferase